MRAGNIESIEQMCQEHHEEMQRRQESFRQQLENQNAEFPDKGFFGADPAKAAPFEVPEQTHVVFGLSHTEMPPRTKDASDPGLRIVGIFASQELAVAHARLLAELDDRCSVLVTNTREWTVMSSTSTMVTDSAALQQHIEQRLQSHQRKLKKAKLEFEAKLAQVSDADLKTAVEDVDKEGHEEVPVGKEEAKAEKEPEEAEEVKSAAALLFPRDAEVKGQNFAVVAFVRDESDSHIKHPIFKVFGAFDTETEATEYIQNTAGKYVFDFDLDVVQLCVWLRPQHLESGELNNVHYRHKIEDEVLNFQRSQKSVLAAFKNECQEQGVGVPYIDLE